MRTWQDAYEACPRFDESDMYRTAEVDALLGLAEDCAVIGDCKKAFRVRGATHDGTFAAINLG